MNLLREPSFELGGRYWTLTSPAAVVDSGARTGTRALWLAVARYVIGGPLYRGDARQARPTLPGKRYRASVWVRPSGDPECAVRLYVASPSTSAPLLLAELGPEADDSWQELSGTYIAAGADSAVILAVREQPDIGAWLLDDAALELHMAARREEIRQALLSALAGIDGQAPYETSPREVLGYFRDPRVFPAIQIVHEQEERELRGYRAVAATLRFEVHAFTGKFNSSDKAEELGKLVADIERAIGEDPSLGLPQYGVQAVITDLEMSRGIDGEVGGVARLTVETPYRFARGEP